MKSSSGVGLGAIFGLIHIASFFVLALLYWNLFTWLNMRHWEEVPAQITSAELDHVHGDDGTTYRALATYKYEYKGQSFTGNRVGIHNWGSDNLGRWQRDTAQRLKQLRQRGDVHLCFVNPQNPEESVLDRNLRPPIMLMETLIAGLLGLISYSQLRQVIQTKLSQRQELSRFESRKLENHDVAKFQDQFVSSPVKTAHSMMPAIAFVMVVFLPTIAMIPDHLRVNTWSSFFLLIGPGILFALAVVAVHSLWRQWIEGSTVVRLASSPGVIGGGVTGVIQTKRDLRPGTITLITLRCLEQTWQSISTGKRRSSAKRTVTRWSAEQEIQADLTPGHGDGSAIPFDFDVPYGLPESSRDEDDQVRWQLSARSTGPGPRFCMKCDLPVQVTGDSQKETHIERASLVESYQSELNSIDRLKSFGVRIKDGPGSYKRLKIRGGKSIGPMLFLIGFMLAADIGLIALLRADSHWIVIGIVGFFAFVLTLGFLHTMMWGCRILVSPSMAMIRSGATPFCRTHKIPVSDFTKLETAMTLSSGENNYYEVFLATDRKRLRIGKGIRGKERAQTFAKAVWQEVVGTEPPELTSSTFNQRKESLRQKRAERTER